MKLKIPAALGACCDLLYKLREERLKLNAKIEDLRKQENELGEHLINKFSKSELRKAAGQVASVSVDPREIPTIADFDALTKYVVKHKAFDLFQRRLNEQAVQERWRNKEKIPGLDTYTVIKVRPHKLPKKRS